MNCERICSKCGTTFTLDGAMATYGSFFNFDLDYFDDYSGEICGNCAIDDMEDRIANQ